MSSQSAGILLYRRKNEIVETLLVHPGGPFWSMRDLGAWSIPKGEYGEGEDAARAARREFEEELGRPPPDGDHLALGEVVQAGGKRVRAWALAGDFDTSAMRSNMFEMEWPPHSGKRALFPEIDRAAWFGLDVAAQKIVPAQRAFLDRLAELASTPPRDPSQA